MGEIMEEIMGILSLENLWCYFVKRRIKLMTHMVPIRVATNTMWRNSLIYTGICMDEATH